MKKLKNILLIICLSVCVHWGHTQTQVNEKLSSAAYTEEVKNNLSESVPFISIGEFIERQDEYILLDAREKNEYDVSHIPKALHIGFNRPNYDLLNKISKEKPLVIYCSIGYRSEKIGEKLIKKGYKVYNLYGSIFEWANRNLELHTSDGLSTKKIHGYNKSWSRWLEHPALKVTY